MRLVVGLGLLLAVDVGCTKPNPAYCDDSSTCANGMSCDVNMHTCVPNGVDASSTCAANSECNEPSLPVCGTDGACRACALDDECDSGVCRSDGACETEENVLYVSPSGASAGQCTKSSPCELFYARSLLTETRASIRLANGSYMLASVFNVSPPMSAVTIAGGRGALIQRTASGPTFEVRNGGDLTIRGISFTRGVECARSTLAVRGAGFDAPTETRSWMVLDQCTTSVDGCELLNSSSQGIEELNSGHLTVTNTKVARSAGNGVRALDVFSIERSTIESNVGVGILASTQSAVVARCSISLNRGGGLSVVGGRFDVTNNFITRNGTEQPPVSLFGGMRLQTGLSGNRVEHNTVVRNDTDPGSMYAGGIYCEGGGNFTNNLIANNFAGNASLPNAQTGGNCNQVGSLVSADDSPFHFVRSNVEPFDYHLADAQSIAANVGMVTSQPQAVDFDGDARSDGMPDVGADELEQ